ncbi:universal stress protein [Nocardia sp. PE-7]|uniref:universal stress protein n=1 Tax=Nocardia sp. PE-7 TaxID=3058426 RepID=UPI002657E7FD|nr:universal stress protein [Nocardia sp. PE-7]WKG13057.1 universal stress protein [Nocardia sp. PE-7]
MTALTTRPVVVGVDGSASASSAVRWAARTAMLRGAPLHAVHAMSSGWDLGDHLGVFTLHHQGFRDAGEEALAAARAVAHAETAPYPLTVRTSLVSPSPISTLRRYARHAQLLVVGARGLGVFERTLLGSVSGALARRPRCPLAVIPGPQPPELRHLPVLVGVDGSPASRRAVEFAIGEASRRGVGLVAISLWNDPRPETRAPETAHRLLTESLARYREEYPDVDVTRLVAHGEPAHRLVRESAGAQLIVLGSHRSGFTRATRRSVSGAVLGAAKVPVVIVGQQSRHRPSHRPADIPARSSEGAVAVRRTSRPPS